MSDAIELLKSFYSFPGMTLLHLDRHFNDLKAQVGLAFYLKSHYVTDQTLLVKMESTWIQMNEKIRSFEKECLKSNEWSQIATQLREENEKSIKNIQMQFNFVDTTDKLLIGSVGSSTRSEFLAESSLTSTEPYTPRFKFMK